MHNRLVLIVECGCDGTKRVLLDEVRQKNVLQYVPPLFRGSVDHGRDGRIRGRGLWFMRTTINETLSDNRALVVPGCPDTYSCWADGLAHGELRTEVAASYFGGPTSGDRAG